MENEWFKWASEESSVIIQTLFHVFLPRMSLGAVVKVCKYVLWTYLFESYILPCCQIFEYSDWLLCIELGQWWPRVSLWAWSVSSATNMLKGMSSQSTLSAGTMRVAGCCLRSIDYNLITYINEQHHVQFLRLGDVTWHGAQWRTYILLSSWNVF